MKKLGVLLLLIVIFFSPIVSIVGAPSVYAIDDLFGGTSKNMRQVFPPSGSTGAILDENAGHDWLLKPDSVSIVKGKTSSGQIWQPTTDMKFHVTLKLHQEDLKKAEDTSQDGDNKGKVDEGDDIGDWDSIFDTDMENSRENGVFLFINKVVDQPYSLSYPTTGGSQLQGQSNTTLANFSLVRKNNAPQSVATLEKDYFITKVTGTGADLSVKAMKIGQSRAINIGHFILRDKPAAFFKNGTIEFDIAVSGLEADTQYTYGILVVEDIAGVGFRDYAYTHDGIVSENNTFRTLPAGTPNPNGEEITASLNTSGSAEGNTTLSEEAQANTIFGQEVKCEATSPTTWVSGCLLFLYHIIYQVSSWILRISAGFMDIFMAYSLSDYMYRNGFIETGWSVVRDVCNMLFIFILLWTAFKMVINDHHFNAKQVISKILIIGIFINFSLFFSKVVIDLGNISARVFYNQIRISGTAQDDVAAGVDSNTLGIKPVAISEAIANGIGFGRIESTGYQKLGGAAGADLSFGVLFLLITLGILLNLFAAFILVKVSFAFLGRILSLWMAMIFSPFAFTSTILSGGHGHGGPLDIQKIGWHDWLKNLLNAAFYPAIFLFFLLLITILIKDDFLAGAILANDQLNGTAWIVTFLLNAAFLLGLLKVAGDLGQKMAGTFGEELAALAGKAAGFVGGAAIGVVTGGAALGLQRFGGGSAAINKLNGDEGALLKKASTGDFEAMAKLRTDYGDKYKNFENNEEGRKKAQKEVESLQKKAGRDFDLRNTKPMQTLSNATGLNFNAGTSALGLSTNNTVGGYQAMVDRKASKEAAYFKSIGASEDEIKRAKEGVDETKKELEEAEKNTRNEIARLEEENKNFVQRAQAGDTLTDAEKKKIKDNQKTIQDNKTLIDKAHDQAKAKGPDGKFTDIPPLDPSATDEEKETHKIALAKRAQLEADMKLKDSTKSGLRKYQEYLQTHPAGRNNSSFGGFGLRKLMAFEFKGAASAFAKDFKNALSGAWRGALVGSVVPGVGTMAGAIGGAIGGGILSTLNNTVFANKLGKDADHAIAANHIHEPHGKAKYTTPNSSWFEQMFKGGLPKGGSSHGGGGGGHDDHGAHH